MSNKLVQELENRRLELISRIKLCEENKSNIINFVKKLNKEYDHGIISDNEYNRKLDSFLKGKTIEEWIKYYDNSIEHCNNEIEKCYETKVKIPIKNILIITIILLVLGSAFFLTPTITGFVVGDPTLNVTDGYGIEGTGWSDIKGSMMYTSCTKVRSDISFDDIKISAKITRATDKNDLTLAIFNNSEKDEPSNEIGNCIVKDYSNIFKSCTVKNINLEPNDYWICAYSPSGDMNVTYYTIGYSNSDTKKRVIYTGKYWQKLEKASYTIKSEFIKW